MDGTDGTDEQIKGRFIDLDDALGTMLKTKWRLSQFIYSVAALAAVIFIQNPEGS